MRAPPEANGTVADTTWHTSFSVPTGHLVFEGHFPQQPIVPGVLLVSLLLDALAERFGAPLVIDGIPQIKFITPVGPDVVLDAALVVRADAILFDLAHQGTSVARGTLHLRTLPPS